MVHVSSALSHVCVMDIFYQSTLILQLAFSIVRLHAETDLSGTFKSAMIVTHSMETAALPSARLRKLGVATVILRTLAALSKVPR